MTQWPLPEPMALALEQARLGAQAGEVPIGAVVMRDGKVIAAAHNRPRALCDPTAHAEVLAIRAAAQVLGQERLEGCDLWVSLEPCPMCAGAIAHARSPGSITRPAIPRAARWSMGHGFSTIRSVCTGPRFTAGWEGIWRQRCCESF
jgi:tRNA(Arg) A34 adenosine deaminase TadA